MEFELLVRAAQGVPFRGFTTEVVGMEFLRNAYMGFGAGERFRTYHQDELESFLLRTPRITRWRTSVASASHAW